VTTETRYSIGELARQAGVTRRTVRFYVQRGLIPQPLGRGRGEHYAEEHLAAVLRVRSLQEQGASLEEIRQHHEGEPPVAGRADETVALGTEAEDAGDVVESARPHAEARTPWWRPGDGAGRPQPRPALGRRPGQVWVRQMVMPGHELHSLGAENALTERQLAALAQLIYQLQHEGGDE
jgi:DNA-binding transcriptional MerR regulator